MANVEIDESELAALKNVAGLVNKGLNNPKSRESILRALKAANPELPVPELDAKDPILEQMKEMRDEQKKFMDSVTERENKRVEEENLTKLKAKWEVGQSKARKMGYDDESLKVLEKFMEDNGVADHEIAAAAFEKLHPQPKPIANTSGKFNFFQPTGADDFITKSLDELKAGKINETQFLDGSVDKVLSEIRAA